MLILRSLLFLLGQMLAAVLFTPAALIFYPLPPVTRSRLIAYWARFVIWWLGFTCRLYFHVEGREHLPATASVILSKHQSAWETIAFQIIFPPQAWVLKRELLWIPFFGWGLAATQPVAIDRKAGVKALDKVIREGTDRLRSGRWVVVFPEGTRVAPGERGRYNPGGAMLAVRAGVPVVPVAHDAGRYWPRWGWLKYPGRIQVIIGPPISTTGARAKQVSRSVECWIEAAMEKLERDRAETIAAQSPPGAGRETPPGTGSSPR
jgi:1-acyl-sn-glycerol-3-phosphate acyltransferase